MIAVAPWSPCYASLHTRYYICLYLNLSFQDGNIGEACIKDGVGAKLLFFSTVGKKATFLPHVRFYDCHR